MNRSMKLWTLTLAAACLAAGAGGVHAATATLCWVDHVYQNGNGVAVTFRDIGQIVVVGADTLAYDSAPGGYQLLRDDGASIGDPVAAVPMALGDQAHVENSPEDACTIEVIRQDGIIGIS